MNEMNKMNHFVPHHILKKDQLKKWTKWIILSPTYIQKKDIMNKMNKMNHFVPHQYSEKGQNEQNEQNESFCPPPIFWKKTKWIILSPTFILKKDKMNKMNKMNHFVTHLYSQKTKWRQNDKVSFSTPSSTALKIYFKVKLLIL